MSLGRRGALGQVTVVGDGDEELDPGVGVGWGKSHGSNGEWKKGKKRKREKEGGTFRVPGECLFLTREEAETHLREALREGDDGDDVDDGYDRDDEGDKGDDKGEGGDKGGEVLSESGGEKVGDTGVAGSKDEPQLSPTTQEGSLRVATRAWGLGGGRGANRAKRADRAHPPHSDPAPARQVTFQLT